MNVQEGDNTTESSPSDTKEVPSVGADKASKPVVAATEDAASTQHTSNNDATVPRTPQGIESKQQATSTPEGSSSKDGGNHTSEPVATGDDVEGKSKSTHASGKDDKSNNKRGHGMTLRKKTVQSYAEDDGCDENGRKRHYERVFKKGSDEHCLFVDLCLRKGWLEGGLPKSNTAKGDPDLVAFMERTGFTRTQVKRKFHELELSILAEKYPNPQALNEAHKRQREELRHRKQEAKNSKKKKLWEVDIVIPDPMPGVSTSNEMEAIAVVNNVGQDGRSKIDSLPPSAAMAVHPIHSQPSPLFRTLPKLPPIDVRDLEVFCGSPTDQTRAVSPFGQRLRKVVSPTPWGPAPPPPDLQQYSSWVRPNTNEGVLPPPALTRLATADVHNLMQSPLHGPSNPTTFTALAPLARLESPPPIRFEQLHCMAEEALLPSHFQNGHPFRANYPDNGLSNSHGALAGLANHSLPLPTILAGSPHLTASRSAVFGANIADPSVPLMFSNTGTQSAASVPAHGQVKQLQPSPVNTSHGLQTRGQQAHFAAGAFYADNAASGSHNQHMWQDQTHLFGTSLAHVTHKGPSG